MNGIENLSTFREYYIIRQLRISAGQSDIYAVSKNGRDDTQPYFLKLYRFGSPMNEELFRRMLSLGEKHPENIIRIYDCGYDEETGRYFEIQEFIRYGSLSRIISAINESKRDTIVKSVIRQTINSLKILHDNNILHLDLKPSNMLIRSDKPFNIVLTDFGLSSTIDHDASKAQSRVNKGTDNYRAPEAYGGMYHKKTDYWSLGMIIYELLLGASPFAGKTPAEVTGIVVLKNIEISDKIDKIYFPLLKGLLTKNVNLRWGYDEVARWLAGEEVKYETETRYNVPYKFNKTEYYTLKELIAAFCSSEASIQTAKIHLSKGYVVKWLEDEKDFENANKINAIIGGTQEKRTGRIFSELTWLYNPESLNNLKEKTMSIDIGGGVTLDMVLVTAGTFLMGSSDKERDANDDEKPEHAVKISNDYYICKYPVTREQWEKVMGTVPDRPRAGDNLKVNAEYDPAPVSNDPKCPVEFVSWNDCHEFMTKLNVIFAADQRICPFGDFRLPTEAEWEYACRAGNQAKFYWGDDPSEKDIDDHCWYAANSGAAQPVGLKMPNGFGLHDMSGNIFEWCDDWYGENYYSNSQSADPAGPGQGTYRSLRGGSGYSDAGLCRSACRFCAEPDGRSRYCGFRPVLGLIESMVSKETNKAEGKRSEATDIKNSENEKINLNEPIIETLEPSIMDKSESEFADTGTDKLTGSAATGRENAENDGYHEQVLFSIEKENKFKFYKKDINIAINLDNDVKIEMVLIPAGKFQMGSPFNKDYIWDAEDNIHMVSISKAFYICKYPVTWLQWKKLMSGVPGENRESMRKIPDEDNNGDCPVNVVSWDECQDYLRKLNMIAESWYLQSDFGKFRLPTEAEWEYSCRAGTQSRFYWGDDVDEKEISGYAWYAENSNSKLHPVGQKNPNAFGLFDMSGNIWEWCNDFEGLYQSGSVTDPFGPDSGDRRVLRGGCGSSAAGHCRSASRNFDFPSNRGGYGFRFVLPVGKSRRV